MEETRRKTVGLLDSGLSKLLGRSLIAYSLLILLIGWGYEISRIRDDRAATIAAETQALRLVSASAESKIDAAIERAVDASVAVTSAFIAKGEITNTERDAISAQLKRVLIDGSSAQRLFVATAEMFAYADAAPLQEEQRPQWLAEMLATTRVQNDAGVVTWIGAPIALQKTNASAVEMFVPFARRVANAKDQNVWAGALLEVSLLAKHYSDVHLEHGSIVFVTGRGDVLLRVPQLPKSVVGQRVSQSRLFNRLYGQIPSGGIVVEDVSPLSNQPWLFSIRRLRDYELTAVAGREMQSILMPWAQRTRESLQIAVVLSIAVLLFTAILKRMASVIDQRSSYYRVLFDNTAVSIFLGEGDTFLEANATAYRMFRIPTGKPMDGIHPWDLSPEYQPNGQPSKLLAAQFITRAALEGQVTFDWLHKRIDTNEPFPAQVNLSSVTLNSRTYYLALVRDTSELEIAHRELEILNAELERRVGQRTVELQQAYLNVAAANEELEAFTAAASHDLRSPLSAISGHAGLLDLDIKQSRYDQVARRIERILRGVQKTGEVIDGLLSLARLSRHDLLNKSVDLAALARESMRELQNQNPQRTFDLVIDIRSTLHADPRLMASLLSNLLGNAWKYTANRARARIEFIEEGEVFSIRDNGEGFDMASAHLLFQPFRRLHPADAYPGLGVGLATVARIVKRYGGRIWAESDPVSGTVFYFTLPQARESVDNAVNQ